MFIPYNVIASYLTKDEISQRVIKYCKTNNVLITPDAVEYKRHFCIIHRLESKIIINYCIIFEEFMPPNQVKCDLLLSGAEIISNRYPPCDSRYVTKSDALKNMIMNERAFIYIFEDEIEHEGILIPWSTIRNGGVNDYFVTH